MANVNGVEINLMPTKGMREEAQRYRNWKKEGEAGGTDDARTRATQILSGNELSPDTVITMNAWFARHQSDKSGKGFRQGTRTLPAFLTTCGSWTTEDLERAVDKSLGRQCCTPMPWRFMQRPASGIPIKRSCSMAGPSGPEWRPSWRPSTRRICSSWRPRISTFPTWLVRLRLGPRSSCCATG